MAGKDEFKEAIQEQFGFSEEESEKIFQVYKELEAGKFDSLGQFKVVHGYYWTKLPMDRALELYKQVEV